MQISEKTGKPVTEVKNAIIWGNHSSTQYPDVNHGTVGGKPIREVVKDDEWLNGEFITTVQQRGAAIIKVRPRAGSCQNASTRGWHQRARQQQLFPMIDGSIQASQRGQQAAGPAVVTQVSCCNM